MSKTPRSPTESVTSDFSEGSIFCGVGSPRPKPRLLSGTLFGHVEGAFDEKTLPIGYGCEKKAPKKSSPDEKNEGEEVEEKSVEEVSEEKKTEENGVDSIEGKEETKEEKENGETKENDHGDPDVDAGEAKGPLPVSEGVSLRTDFLSTLKNIDILMFFIC